jgi:hypothetical protein
VAILSCFPFKGSIVALFVSPFRNKKKKKKKKKTTKKKKKPREKKF